MEITKNYQDLSLRSLRLCGKIPSPAKAQRPQRITKWLALLMIHTIYKDLYNSQQNQNAENRYGNKNSERG
jgi:hypothetical protein